MQHITDAFRLADATSPDRATTFDALSVDADQSETRRLISDGVLAPARQEGFWYLNEVAFIAHRDARHVRLRVAVLVVVLVALAFLATGMVLVRR